MKTEYVYNHYEAYDNYGKLLVTADTKEELNAEIEEYERIRTFQVECLGRKSGEDFHRYFFTIKCKAASIEKAAKWFLKAVEIRDLHYIEIK